MREKEFREIEAMLVVLYKKIDKLENQLNNAVRSSSDSDYLAELKREASKIHI